MTEQKFNSIAGFSVGEDANSVIDGNSTVTANNLSAIGNVEFTGAEVALGNVANLSILGGANGQIITTDGTGNLSFVDTGSGGDGQVPTLIPEGETYIVLENKQVLFNLPINVQGDLVVNGFLIQVD